MKEIEDAALEVHRHVREAVNHAEAGNLRKAHAEAEQAQGAENPSTLGTSIPGTVPGPSGGMWPREHDTTCPPYKRSAPKWSNSAHAA